MAPNTTPSTAIINDSDQAPTAFSTLESFLQKYGNAEWILYKKDNAAPHLSYEEWASSERVLGPYLYRLTLDVWDEPSTDDEMPEQPVKSTRPGLPEREPTVTMNGNGMPHIADASTLNEDSKEEEPLTSAKKRQRRKKKLKSEAIVASEDSDENLTRMSVAEVATPQSAAVSTSGRKSSLVQRHKKTSLPAPNSPLQNLEQPAPLSKIVKLPLFALDRQKKKIQSEPIVSAEDEKETIPFSGAATPVAAAIASPEGSNSSSAIRRGLRVRTPAQQRPYFHHAKLFDEAEVNSGEADKTKSPPKVASTKRVQVVYPHKGEDVNHSMQDQEMNGHIEPELKPLSEKKPKGRPKGRRSTKKFEDDEDPEFHAPATVLQTIQPPSDPKPKRKARTKKSLQLSEAYVMDSSDEERLRREQSDEIFTTLMDSPLPHEKPPDESPHKAPARHGRPKKSASIIISSENEEGEEERSKDEGSVFDKTLTDSPPNAMLDSDGSDPLEFLQSDDDQEEEDEKEILQNLLADLNTVQKCRPKKSASNGVEVNSCEHPVPRTN